MKKIKTTFPVDTSYTRDEKRDPSDGSRYDGHRLVYADRSTPQINRECDTIQEVESEIVIISTIKPRVYE